MRALSLTQPWATLVALGAKSYETRSWSTSYRGPLLIHAAKSFPADCRELCDSGPFLRALKNDPVSPAHYTIAPPEHWYYAATPRYAGGLPLGACVALARLVNVSPTERFENDDVFVATDEYAVGDYSEGRFAWRLASVQPLPTPIPWKGALGLWHVPADLEHAVAAQLAAAEA